MATARKARPDLAARNRAAALHGMTHTRTFSTWKAMLERCNTPTSKDYPRYGARGIVVCDRWRDDFNAFFNDMGERPEGASLDRIDVNAGYDPNNCRWATPKEQARNRRSGRMIEFRGQVKCLAQWADDLGIERKALAMRLRVHPVEVAFTTPYQPRQKEAS